MFINKCRYFILTTIFLSIVLLILFTFTSKNRQYYLRIVPSNPTENEFSNATYRLFDLKIYHLLDNPEICKDDPEIEALIIVTSYFGNVETRSAMRRAYSSGELKKMSLRRMFMLAQSPSDKYTSQKAVENESKRFRDIIQGSFIEAYRNLTYKHAMGLRWAKNNCPSVKFIIKMDDDIVVNLNRLPELLKFLKAPEDGLFIAGYILRNMVPVREPANKWYVTQEEYGSSLYPPFVSGWFYVTTPKACDLLLNLAQSVKYFWIDDTYFTGILAQKLHIQHYDIGRYFTIHSEFLDCCINDVKNKNQSCDIMVGPNGGNNNLFFEFNSAMNLCNTKSCRQREMSMNETCVAERRLNLGRGNPHIRNYKLNK